MIIKHIKLFFFLFFLLIGTIHGKAQGCQGCLSGNSGLNVENMEIAVTHSNTDEFEEISDDEFSEVGDEFSESDDEFEDWDEAGSDEFSEELNNASESTLACATTCSIEKQNKKLNKVLIVLAITILSGFFVRHHFTRKLRGFFLLASVVILGFIQGACPCPISSMQNLVLFSLGEAIHWHNLIWFLALIPITYFLGKVWCGWICHLGALQELIHLPGKFTWLKSSKSVKILRYIRIVTLITLIIQLIVTRTNLFIHYDPFKVAFNLFSINTTGYVLLVILLISSVLIYRPFCRTFCPIGLILGWVSRIPGASVIGLESNCTSCKKCNDACKLNAITRDEKISILDNQECIACGDCLNSCNKSSLKFFRKNKKHHHVLECTAMIKPEGIKLNQLIDIEQLSNQQITKPPKETTKPDVKK